MSDLVLAGALRVSIGLSLCELELLVRPLNYSSTKSLARTFLPSDILYIYASATCSTPYLPL